MQIKKNKKQADISEQSENPFNQMNKTALLQRTSILGG